MGTIDIKIDNRSDGRRPVITPRIVAGTFKIKPRNGSRVVREVILEIEPMNATGTDQKMMRATTKETVNRVRIVLSHHLILRLVQIISLGLIPMNRGLM